VEETTGPVVDGKENGTHVRDIRYTVDDWIKFRHYRIQLYCKYNLFQGNHVPFTHVNTVYLNTM
jgi:hypothetical protein